MDHEYLSLEPLLEDSYGEKYKERPHIRSGKKVLGGIWSVAKLEGLGLETRDLSNEFHEIKADINQEYVNQLTEYVQLQVNERYNALEERFGNIESTDIVEEDLVPSSVLETVLLLFSEGEQFSPASENRQTFTLQSLINDKKYNCVVGALTATYITEQLDTETDLALTGEFKQSWRTDYGGHAWSELQRTDKDSHVVVDPGLGYKGAPEFEPEPTQFDATLEGLLGNPDLRWNYDDSRTRVLTPDSQLMAK